MATYYAFDGESLYVEGYFASHILNNTDEEQLFWIAGAEKLNMNPKYINGELELNGRKYTKNG